MPMRPPACVLSLRLPYLTPPWPGTPGRRAMSAAAPVGPLHPLHEPRGVRPSASDCGAPVLGHRGRCSQLDMIEQATSICRLTPHASPRIIRASYQQESEDLM